MIKLPAFLFLLLLGSLTVFSQPTIKGRVVNAANGEPLPGSSVFISNSSIGIVSDKDGRFELHNIPVGKHELVVSSIGYETNVFSFSAAQLPLQVRIEMEVKVRELPNVTVEPSVEEGWDKWGKLFTENFIGHIPNAINCKVKNQKAIRFRYFKKSNRVIAYADEPIILENKALGYKISYQLEDFEVNFKANSTAYAGYPFFEDMDKNRKGLQKRWQRKREQAYYGSMMHFMRSLYNNKLSEEGFEVRRMKRIPNEEKERVKKIYRPTRINNGTVKISAGPAPAKGADNLLNDSAEYYQRILKQKDYEEVYEKALLTADSLIVNSDGGYKTIFFPDYLYITYKNEMEDKEYIAFHRENRAAVFQRSYIWLINLTPIAIDANGSYYPPKEIFSMAYWAWDEKMANTLPIDYTPSK